MRERIVLFLLFIVLLTYASASAAEQIHFSVHDPVGDDHGPGYYVYPKNPVYAPGSFDLTNFEVNSFKGVVKFEFTFKKAFYTSGGIKSPTGGVLRSEVGADFYLQNIEVYIDKDGLTGAGESVLLPGRGATIASGSEWERAILITPLPSIAEAEIKKTSSQFAGKVLIPKDYVVSGNKVVCEVSTKEIGEPDPYWGYIVIVTPADFGAAKEKPLPLSVMGYPVEEALLLRPVKQGVGGWDFGGGDPSGLSPNIIDMIVPSGESQEKVLSSYNLITGSRAQLKAFYPVRGDVSAETEFRGKDFYAVKATILAFENKMITIDKGQSDGMYVGRIGKVVNEDGEEVTEVIVTQVYDSYSVCKIMKVSMLSYVAERMTVLFR